MHQLIEQSMNQSIRQVPELSLDVWDTVRSSSIIEDLTDWENREYGPDFECTLQQLQPWLDSDSFFCNCICENSQKVPVPISVASIIAVTKESFDLLVAGRIREIDLEPWIPCDNLQPILYFASLISRTKGYSNVLMISLISETITRLRSLSKLPLAFNSVFAIACTRPGENYLRREGFSKSEGTYLGKYPILSKRMCANDNTPWQLLITERRSKGSETDVSDG